MASVAKPDTILAWYRKLVAGKFDGSKARRGPGRPRISPEIEQLIMRMAGENKDWGYDRIVGALANLGHVVCDQTVGNVLLRHGVPPAPERKRTTTWREFIRIHLALLAGTDFFTAEVLTLRGLVTYYVLFSTAIPIPETQPAPQAIQAGTSRTQIHPSTRRAISAEAWHNYRQPMPSALLGWACAQIPATTNGKVAWSQRVGRGPKARLYGARHPANTRPLRLTVSRARSRPAPSLRGFTPPVTLSAVGSETRRL